MDPGFACDWSLPFLAIAAFPSFSGKMSASGELLERMVVTSEISGSNAAAEPSIATSPTPASTATATTVTAGGAGGDEEEEWLYGGTCVVWPALRGALCDPMFAVVLPPCCGFWALQY